jgi:16S rRNA processing protein RimM
MDQHDLVPLGKVVGTHGVKGEIKVLSYAESRKSFQEVGRVFLAGKGFLNSYNIVSVRPHKNLLLIRLKEIPSKTEAEELVSAQICVLKDDLEGCGEGEYYWFDIVGLQVYTDKGRHMGRVQRIFATGSNDVYVASDGGHEYLIPATSECVQKIDIENRTMVVKPLPGLWDLDEK